MSGRARFGGELARPQLRHQHARQHQRATEIAAQVQGLGEEQGAGDGGEHRFQGQDDRRMGSDGVLLRHHLQGEAGADAEQAAV